ncbi:MAG: HAD family hydrolase [Candidatus Woesearchaeota archaeon]
MKEWIIKKIRDLEYHLFDFDGVVNDSIYPVYLANNEMIQVRGLNPISFEEWKKHTQGTPAQFFEAYLDISYNDEERNLVNQEFSKTYAEVKANNPPKIYPFAFDALIKFSDKPMIIVSSSPEQELQDRVDEYNIRDMFDLGVFGEVYDKTGFIKEFLKENNVKRELAVIIGDSTKDIYAGQQNGIEQIAVSCGIQDEVRLKESNPSLGVFKDIKYLADLL